MKYIAVWYNQDTVVMEEEPIEASNMEEAKRLAYLKYNGTPPAPLLYIKQVLGEE